MEGWHIGNGGQFDLNWCEGVPLLESLLEEHSQLNDILEDCDLDAECEIYDDEVNQDRYRTIYGVVTRTLILMKINRI